MSRLHKLQKTRRIHVIVEKYFKIMCGVMVGVPFILGIVCFDLDATMATYSLMITMIIDTKVWMIPGGYIAYKVYKGRQVNGR